MEPTAPPRTTSVRARTWPWLVAAAAVSALLFAGLVDPTTARDPIWIGLISLITLEFVIAGALLVTRVPGNRVGAIMLPERQA